MLSSGVVRILPSHINEEKEYQDADKLRTDAENGIGVIVGCVSVSNHKILQDT